MCVTTIGESKFVGCVHALAFLGYMHVCKSSLIVKSCISETRVCGSDHTTLGPCLTLVATPLDWHAADNYCKNNLTFAGHLVYIEDERRQDLVAQEVTKRGWEETWINGCLKERTWFWQGCKTKPSYTSMCLTNI